MPIDFRKPSGKTVSVIIAKATVTALKATVRPAVRIVVRTARPGALLGELLAEAGDEEQRVVDRQAEPEADHEVEREDRERVRLVDRGQDEERAEDGGDPDRERQHRGAAAEEEQREQQQDREGEHLGAPEVLGDASRRSGSARTPSRRAGRRRSRGKRCSRPLATVVLVGVGGERREQVGRAAVAARASAAALTDAIPGCAASSWPHVRRPGSGVRISATTPGVACVPVAASICASARAEPDDVAAKPPSVCSDPATGPPSDPGDHHEQQDEEQRALRASGQHGHQ